MERLELTQEWDKTFPKSDKVDHEKVQFPTRFGMTLAADVYRPKGARGALAALAVCGPFGAVKEQSSGIYAQAMAERGYLAVAVDPAFTGESGGWPRNVASPDIATEDYGAAVDYLTTRDDVDPGRIGISVPHMERGHDADGAENPAYCKWCYDQGNFAYETMDNVIETSAPYLVEATGMSLDEAVSFMGALLPTLDHWKTEDNDSGKAYIVQGVERFGENS